MFVKATIKSEPPIGTGQWKDHFSFYVKMQSNANKRVLWRFYDCLHVSESRL